MRNRSTKRTLGAMALAFESFAVFFATLVAFGLKVSTPVNVWTVGLGLALLMIITPGILGRRGGYGFAWLLQAVVLGLSIYAAIAVAAGWLFILVAVIFIGLWMWAMIAGSTIDKARTAWQRANGDSDADYEEQPNTVRVSSRVVDAEIVVERPSADGDTESQENLDFDEDEEN